jgi:hypothetical protein
VRAALTVLVFMLGAVGGGSVQLTTVPKTQDNPYASLSPVEEPAAAKRLATLIAQDNARALADALDDDALQGLAQAMEPMLAVFEVKFVGAVEKRGEVLSAYVVQGQNMAGESERVGFVLRVRAGEVVGVN